MPVPVFLLGDKLLDRLRNATIAMLGFTTAVGLVLVALILQQGWPSVFGGPLPGFSNEPPADEAASAAPGIPAGGTASTLQSGVDAVSSRPGPASGGGGLEGPTATRGSHEVAASDPVASSPEPAPGEGVSQPPPVPSTPGAAPAPAPAAVAPPSTAQTSPAASAKAGDEDGDSVMTGVESKKPRGKDKVTANGKAPASKPKPSRSKPQPSPVDKVSAEPAPGKAAPPAYAPDKNETETLPVEEKGERGFGHGHSKDD